MKETKPEEEMEEELEKDVSLEQIIIDPKNEFKLR